MLNIKDILKAIEVVKEILGGVERDIYFDAMVIEEVITNEKFENMNYKEMQSLVFNIIDDEVSKNLDRLG